MTDQPRKRPLTPAELLAAHDRRMGRPTARDRDIAERVETWRGAESVVLAALRAAGVDVPSLADLAAHADRYPDAPPVLLEQLELDVHPPKVREDMACALAVRRSLRHWDRIVTLWRRAGTAAEADALAGALAACATEERLDDLLELVADPSLGPARSRLLDALFDLGGRRVRRFLDGLRDDSDIGGAVAAELERRPLRRPR